MDLIAMEQAWQALLSAKVDVMPRGDLPGVDDPAGRPREETSRGNPLLMLASEALLIRLGEGICRLPEHVPDLESGKPRSDFLPGLREQRIRLRAKMITGP